MGRHQSWRATQHYVKDEHRSFITALYKYSREQLLEYVLDNLWKHNPEQRYYKDKEFMKGMLDRQTKIGLAYFIGSFQDSPVLQS